MINDTLQKDKGYHYLLLKKSTLFKLQAIISIQGDGSDALQKNKGCSDSIQRNKRLISIILLIIINTRFLLFY